MKNKILKNTENRFLTGFTIIELIVVIAIIAVLATIVSANVVQYISKAKDSAIKAQVEQIRTAAADYVSTSTVGYFNMCIFGTECYKLESNITSNLGGLPQQESISNSTYCLPFSLNNGNWCIDSTGYSGLGGSCNPMPPHNCVGS